MSSSKRFEASGPVDAKPLAEPLSFAFSKRTAKNRLMKAAMAEALATWDSSDVTVRGVPTKELIELYRRWGEHKNGWGIILTGNVSIELDQPIAGAETVITLESPFAGERFEAFKTMAAVSKAKGSLIIAQVSHPGRQVKRQYNAEAISASAVQLEPKGGTSYGTPREATKADIARVVAGFAHAAQYLEKAGYDGIELHGAHGYLLAQFLAKTTNRRTDEYGGSLANRARLLVEVVREVRRRVSPSFIVSVKLNSVEFQHGGFSPEEAAELCTILQADDLGLDFIELSGGTYEESGLAWRKESTRKREAYFLEFVELIVPALGPADQRKTKIFLTGGLRTVPAMVKVLDVVDGVGIGRPATQEPRLAADIVEGRVSGAIHPAAPFDNDTNLGLVSSVTQIHQIAEGREPFDLSNEAAAATFRKDMGLYFANPPDVGHVPFSGKTEPYRSGEIEAA